MSDTFLTCELNQKKMDEYTYGFPDCHEDQHVTDAESLLLIEKLVRVVGLEEDEEAAAAAPGSCCPSIDDARLLALAGALRYLESRDGECEDLAFKHFVDITGGGCGLLAAGFLFRFSSVASYESSESRKKMVVALKQHALHTTNSKPLTDPRKWRIHALSIVEADIVDADCVFVDATRIEPLDEGVFLRYVGVKLTKLQPGSYAVFYTLSEWKSIASCPSCRLVFSRYVAHLKGKLCVTIFRTTEPSTDHRLLAS